MHCLGDNYNYNSIWQIIPKSKYKQNSLSLTLFSTFLCVFLVVVMIVCVCVTLALQIRGKHIRSFNRNSPNTPERATIGQMRPLKTDNNNANNQWWLQWARHSSQTSMNQIGKGENCKYIYKTNEIEMKLRMNERKRKKGSKTRRQKNELAQISIGVWVCASIARYENE